MDSFLELGLLVIVGFIAGSLNTIAGGGSLITYPLLIFMGLPAAVANGTNRIAILFQNIFNTAGFRSKGVSVFPFSIYLAISALLGSLIGAQVAVDIKGELFNRIMAVVMLLVVVYMIFKPNISLTNITEELKGKKLWLSTVIFFFIGIYGGFIQAGVGFIMLVVLSSVNNLSLVKSNAVKVFVVLIYTIAAVSVFFVNDKINWKIGLVLALGNSLGGWFASRWSVNKGDKIIRNIIVVVVSIMAIKLWFF